MQVLILGGSGNISREIVRALLERGHTVTTVTRGQRPVPEGARAVTVDRRDRAAFEARMAEERPDVIIDMIAFTPEDTESALAAFGGRVGQFIHCSTVMTYGPPVERIGADETAALNAQTDYGRNKNRIDAMLLERHAAEGLPVTIVKPSYTYGPGIPLHRQIGDDGRWIDRLRKGKPMLSSGDGETVFQFLPSRDAGEFFALLVGRDAVIGEVLNMVHPQPITWDTWHRFAMAAVGREVDIVHAPMNLLVRLDPQRYDVLPRNFGHSQVFSGAKAAALLPDWQPATPHVDWMATNIAWMDEQGLVVDTDADDDDLEDRIIERMRG